MAGSIFYRTFDALLYTVQTGDDGMVKSLGMSPFEYLAKNPEEGKIFDRMMTDFHGGETEPMLENYDFLRFQYGGGYWWWKW
jgi:hypothetical protein